MQTIKQMLLALGVMASPIEHPPEPCLDHCQISDVGRALVRNFEGYSPFRYRDSAGFWTIGVGHLIRPGEHFEEPLLGDAAEALFEKDLGPKVAAVNARVSVPLYQNMAEDHTCKGVGECHPYREFEGMQSSREMQTSLASATGVSPWVSTKGNSMPPYPWFTILGKGRLPSPRL